MFKLIAVALAAVPLHCAPTVPATVPSRPAQVIHIGEGFGARFDARPGDVIIVTMNPGADWVARCDDMGGEPIANPYTQINECDGVDF